MIGPPNWSCNDEAVAQRGEELEIKQPGKIETFLERGWVGIGIPIWCYSSHAMLTMHFMEKALLH